MSIVKVLYEDNHIIAVFKPAGMLTQGDKSGDVSLFDEVKKYLKEKYKKPGNVFLGLVHRLDRPVQGIVLFAKTSKGAARLSEQFRNHEIEKIYHAVVLGKPEKDRGALIDYLIKDKIKLKSKIREYREFAEKQAVLYYEVVKTNGKYSLLNIKLETGKFHQIRAQLSAAGFPILGDVKYKGEKWGSEKEIALAATAIFFKTATSNEKINLKIDIPENWKNLI